MTDVPPAYRPVITREAPRPIEFQPRGGGRASIARPTKERQATRLDESFDEIQRLLGSANPPSAVQTVPSGDPELVVVFEVLDSAVDVAEAFRAAGLDPVLDLEDEISDEDLGEDFKRLRPSTPSTEPVKRFVHAGMANEEAAAQVIRLWRRWTTGKRMPNGFGPFSQLFSRLRDVHPWSPSDRVRATGLAERLAEAFAESIIDVPVSVELWYRSSAEQRTSGERAVRDLIAAAGGVTHRSADRPEIGYHALAATLPAASLEPVTADDVAALNQVALLRAPEVLFVRAGGQAMPTPPAEDQPAPTESANAPGPTRPPLVAVLDGLPEANHPLLRGRVQVVDPDDLAGHPAYLVERRRHGTMVASAVLWGDLSAGHNPTDRTVVVRPILRPDMHTANADEGIPWEELATDATIRAVRDVLDETAAPSVRIINLSIGDPLVAFDTIPTAWARAIDWLAYEHNLLFVVSAGNHVSPIPVDIDEHRAADDAGRDRLTAAALAELSPHRRILSPAESINALTVGAVHADASGDGHPHGYNVDPWSEEGRPSPTTAHGRGIRRSIKPDIAAPGGRQLFAGRNGSLVPVRSTLPPGIRVATPPDTTAFMNGTTFAAAEVSRRASAIMSALSEGGLPVPDDRLAVATKALLVHGCRYPTDFDYGVPVDRLFGHGLLERDFAAGCTATQATVLFTGTLGAREQVELRLPFPAELSGRTDIRRITSTLAWISPINWNHRQYRRAKLTFEGPPQIPSQHRTTKSPEHRVTQRGTVQHRCFETTRAHAVDELTFLISCADQAGGLAGDVRFAFAVSVELADDVEIDVYELVRAQLRAQARIT